MTLPPHTIGEMLVDSQVISQRDLRNALDHLDRMNNPPPIDREPYMLGEALKDLGLVNDDMLQSVLAHQQVKRATGEHARAHAVCGLLRTAVAAKRTEIQAIADVQALATSIIRGNT